MHSTCKRAGFPQVIHTHHAILWNSQKLVHKARSKIAQGKFPLVFHRFLRFPACLLGKTATKCNSDLTGATCNNFNRLSGCKHLQQAKKLPYHAAQVNCNLLQQAKNLIISRRGCRFTYHLHSRGRQSHIYISSSFIL